MGKIQRWYDKSPLLKEMMAILNTMSDEEIMQVSRYLYQVVNIYWDEKKNNEEIISVGQEKLSGYYKAYNKRRWYDKYPQLSSAINLLSTLSELEQDQIVNGFLYALREAGLYKMYSSKQKDLIEKETD